MKETAMIVNTSLHLFKQLKIHFFQNVKYYVKVEQMTQSPSHLQNLTAALCQINVLLPPSKLSAALSHRKCCNSVIYDRAGELEQDHCSSNAE